MEVKVTETFRYGGEKYEKGQVEDFPESVAESAIDKGYAEKAEEEVPEIEAKEPEEVPELGEPEESEWKQLDKDLDRASQLPQKWNPERDNPPEPGKTLFGTVKRTGSGPYGNFIVVEEKDTREKYTVWEQTALSDLMSQANADDRIAIRFEGLDTNPRGQKYLNYSIACRSPEGESRL